MTSQDFGHHDSRDGAALRRERTIRLSRIRIARCAGRLADPVSPRPFRLVPLATAIPRRPPTRVQGRRSEGVGTKVPQQGTPCLGPVTQAGCGAICPAYNHGCYRCLGPVAEPNDQRLPRQPGGSP